MTRGPGTSLTVALLVLITAAGVLVCAGLFAPGMPASWDGPSHFVRMQFLERELVPGLRLDGWFPYWYNGFQIFLFYPPMFYAAGALLHGLSFGLVPLLTVYKGLTLAAYLGMPLAIFVMLRTFEVDRWSALAAAAVALGISTFHGFGIEGIFQIGITAHCFAAALLPLALAAWHRGIERGGRTLVLGALAVVLVVQTHFIVSLYLALELGLYLALAVAIRSRPFGDVARRTLVMSGIIVVVIAYWVYPLATHQGILGGQTGFGPPPLGEHLQRFWNGDFLGSRWTNRLALLGLVLCIRRRRLATDFFAASFVLTALLAFNTFHFDDVILHRLFSQILMNRSFSFLGIWTAVLAGIAVADTARWVVGTQRARESAARTAHITIVLRMAVVVAALGLLAADVYARVTPLRRWIITEAAFDRSAERKDYLAAFAWLANHAEAGALVGMDIRLKDFGEAGFNDVFSQIVLRTWRPTLGGLQFESTPSAWNTAPLAFLHEWQPEDLEARFQRYNVGYVVAYNPDAIGNLGRSPLFEKVFEQGRAAIFRVVHMENQLATAAAARIRLATRERERITWEVTPELPDAAIVAAVSYHPYWEATVDGQPVPIERTDDNLMRVRIPRAEPTSLTLAFGRSTVVDALTALSVLLQGGLLLGLAVARRRAVTVPATADERVLVAAERA